MTKNSSIASLINMLESMYNENTRLRKELSELDTLYQQLGDDYIKIQLELNELRLHMSIDDEISESCTCEHCIPVEEMATTHPEEVKVTTEIMPSPASVGHSMVTGTTEKRCSTITAVLSELDQGISVSKRVLINQNLFEYTDESGSNRFTPTKWFAEYALAHGILAAFTGHATTEHGQKTFTWYKVTDGGKQIIKDTAQGNIVWKQFTDGPSEWEGYIPVPSTETK
jgi:hypothetical protein